MLWTNVKQLLPFAYLTKNNQLVYLYEFGYGRKIPIDNVEDKFYDLQSLTKNASNITAIWPSTNTVYVCACWPNSYKVFKIKGAPVGVNDENLSEYWANRLKGSYWRIEQILTLCKHELEDMPNVYKLLDEQRALMSDGRIFNWMEYEPIAENMSKAEIDEIWKQNTCQGEIDYMNRLRLEHPELGLLGLVYPNGKIQFIHDIFSTERLPQKFYPWDRIQTNKTLAEEAVASLVERTRHLGADHAEGL